MGIALVCAIRGCAGAQDEARFVKGVDSPICRNYEHNT